MVPIGEAARWKETWVADTAADHVYIRADFWKSTFKVVDMKMKETPSFREPLADSAEDKF